MNEDASNFSLSIWTWQTILLLSVGLWIYCLVDIVRHKFKNDLKVVWLLIVLFVPTLGSILYLIIGRTRKL